MKERKLLARDESKNSSVVLGGSIFTFGETY
jgi:hypothetical protein